MEQRKLIRLGNSSFAIALPKKWVDKAGLKKGDNIFLEENSNGEIIVMPSPMKKGNKQIIIDLTNKDPYSMKREIRAAYIRGYDLIELKGIKDKKIKDNIKRLTNDFLSFELSESEEDKMLLKDFFSLEEANLSNFIRRIDNNIREMFNIAIDELKKNKISLKKLKEIDDIDKDINKFYFLCSRIFLKGIDNPSILTTLKTNGMKLFNEWWFSFNLESLSDGIKYFIRCVHEKEKNIKKIKNKIYDLFFDIHETYLKGIEAFYKEDTLLASQTMDKTNKLRVEITKLEKGNPLLVPIFHDLDKITRQIYQNAKMILYLKY